jgi:hypothetical protein
VARLEVAVAGGLEAPVELVLDREQQLGGQHAQARILADQFPAVGGLAAEITLSVHS